METITSFVKSKQVELSRSRDIVISFGKFLEDDRILNSKIEEPAIKNLLKRLNSKKIKHQSVSSRIYRENDMEYHLKKDGEENLKQECLAVQNTTLDHLAVRLKLISFTSVPLETFPCRLEYHDILNRSSIIIEYDNMLEVHVITEERDTTSNIRLEIHITRQNIYEDKLMKSLTDLIGLIKETIV